MTTLTLSPIDVSGVISAPDISQLTTVAVDGTGAFDKLMKATKLHLLEEYTAGRITKDEYSAVYVSALNSVMQQSVQFLFNHQNHEKTAAEIGLIRQKTVTELAQTDDTIDIDLGFNGSVDVEGVVAQQLLLLEQQVAESVQNVLNATAQVHLTQQKVVTELSITDDVMTGLPASYGYNFTQADFLGQAGVDKLKTTAETDLVKQKVVTEVGAVNDTLPATTYGQHGSTTVTGMLKTQIDKGKSEVALLDQKSVSELAQTYDTIPAGMGESSLPEYTVTATYDVNGITTKEAGVIGQQKALFDKQRRGFDRDAEQKLSKIMVDSLVAGIAADNGTDLYDSRLNNENIGLVIDDAMSGIGVTSVENPAP